MSKINYTPVLVLAMVVGFVGPRLSSPQDRAAGAPFVYTPPDGFVPARADEIALAGPSVQKVWVFRDEGARYTPTVTLMHTEKGGHVEEADLFVLAQGMPQVFQQSGVTWSELRHQTRIRPDGAHVGLIEGESVKGLLKSRVQQIVFPDDKGTSIVTATFPTDDAARWEPQFDASIANATGVATRVSGPPPWLYALWAAGGAILGYLAMALGVRGKKPRATAEDPAAPARDAPT
jgi:hypothetical protein